MSAVIKVENLSKRYFLGHKQKERFPTLRDEIVSKAVEYGRRLLHPFKAPSGQPLASSSSTEEFWALKDVSFEVKQGDRVGVIGRNGAGKSTLLKILSRITEPTTGKVSLRGRVASLLEVGTGFHPELTGRENIFLNGAILGMGKQEIKRKFDEIVHFSEVEKFLDTPVKRYSSGMYVRLAFSVAAHLEPEILIVDEVLAVGDAAFQKKCLGKMEQVGKDGRTVLFVSHNMGAIQALCSTAIHLDAGEITNVGGTADVIIGYNSEGLHTKSKEEPIFVSKDNQITLDAFIIKNELEHPTDKLVPGKPCSFTFVIKAEDDYRDVRFLLGFNRYIDNYRLGVCDTELTGQSFDLKKGNNLVECRMSDMKFCPGQYVMTLRAESHGEILFYLQGSHNFEILNSDYFGTTKMPDKSWGGSVLLDQQWRIG